jgi:hypothetical protein
MEKWTLTQGRMFSISSCVWQSTDISTAVAEWVMSGGGKSMMQHQADFFLLVFFVPL